MLSIKIPTVLHLHSFEYGDFFRSLPPLFQRVIRKMFQRADHIIVLGRIWESFLIEELGVSKRNVSILYNAAPGPPEVVSRQSGLNRENIRLLFVGQLGTRKGVPNYCKRFLVFRATFRLVHHDGGRWRY